MLVRSTFTGKQCPALPHGAHCPPALSLCIALITQYRYGMPAAFSKSDTLAWRVTKNEPDEIIYVRTAPTSWDPRVSGRVLCFCADHPLSLFLSLPFRTGPETIVYREGDRVPEGDDCTFSSIAPIPEEKVPPQAQTQTQTCNRRLTRAPPLHCPWGYPVHRRDAPRWTRQDQAFR